MNRITCSIVSILILYILSMSSCQKSPQPPDTRKKEKHLEHIEKSNHAMHDGHGEDCDHGEDNDHEKDMDHIKGDDYDTDDDHGVEDDHDNNDDHVAHDNYGKENVHEKEDDDHEKDQDHDTHGHDDKEEIHLTPKAIKLAGLQVLPVTERPIARTIELPGEIGFNEDQLAHITPRFSGVVRQIRKRLGEYVQKGDVLAVIESNTSLSTYSIRAPIAGRIVKKHATTGEFAGEDAALFVIAGLGSVWANCEVYAKDADFIRHGQEILIRAVGRDRQIKATLSYVAPVYNETTRSLIARAHIPNTGGRWKPGTFVTGTVSLESDTSVTAVVKEAVQVLHDETVVFIPVEEHAYKAVHVKTGLADDTYIEIISGLKPGDRYIARGAFELKAKVVTSALGDHAGHGH